MSQRAEFKFIVPKVYEKSLVEFCHRRIRHTSGNGLKFKAYQVTSLYFDTPSLDCFWQKADGEENKITFRLRQYDQHGPVFMETKLTEGRVKHKFRRQLPTLNFKDSIRALSSQPIPWTDNDAEVESLESFHRQIRMGGLKPKLYTQYGRRAYDFSNFMRMTCDSDFKVSRYLVDAMQPSDSIDISHWCWPSKLIIEVKFTAENYWLMPMLDALAKFRLPISKYSVGVQAALGVKI